MASIVDPGMPSHPILPLLQAAESLQRQVRLSASQQIFAEDGTNDVGARPVDTSRRIKPAFNTERGYPCITRGCDGPPMRKIRAMLGPPDAIQSLHHPVKKEIALGQRRLEVVRDGKLSLGCVQILLGQ